MKNVIGRYLKQYVKNKNMTKETQYPDFELVKIISGACLKHHDSGEGSFNKEARIILMELEEKGYKIIKKD